MSKRTSRQSSQPLENTTDKEIINKEINYTEKIAKKSFESATNTTSTITRIFKKESAKDTVKMALIEFKNLKNMRKNQEVILMNIENNDIEKHVSKLFEKFNPPECINCPNRRADRVCTNRACGEDRYMQIICGKCHFTEHQSAINKPEIDIEEYFIKLSTFMNEAKYDHSKKLQQRIDLDNLETVFDDLDLIRQQLVSLRSQIENQIESYSSPTEMQGLLQKSITKALSLCEYDNIKEQLQNVKKSVLFKDNKFSWNNVVEKYKSYSKISKSLEDFAKQTNLKVLNSYIDGIPIDLDKLVVKHCLGSQENSNTENEGKDGEIKIAVSECLSDRQFYLDYCLDPKKKYKLRFRFETIPGIYLLVGVMEKKQCFLNYVCNIYGQSFLKQFQSDSPMADCSRILKGTKLNYFPSKGQQIEMRIDIENNYVDFYDYPEMNNVNANQLEMKFTQEEYIIAFDFQAKAQTIVLESFCEISEINNITDN